VKKKEAAPRSPFLLVTVKRNTTSPKPSAGTIRRPAESVNGKTTSDASGY